MREIFVFGSNLRGMHSDGGLLYGAIPGQSAGLQGNSYAIPVKDSRLIRLPLSEIKKHVKRFITFVYSCNLKKIEIKFYLRAIGCEVEEYTPEDIAPMFEPLIGENSVQFPDEFLKIYLSDMSLKSEERDFNCRRNATDTEDLHKRIQLMRQCGMPPMLIAKKLKMSDSMIYYHIRNTEALKGG